MAARWSSEFIVAEHKDLQASAMAVDWKGTYVLLAGRRYLGIKNLGDPSESLKKFPRQSKYDVGSAEWNPHAQFTELFAISSNQKVEVLSWAQGGLTLTHTLSAHTRVVNDLNWHQFDCNILASCSIDTFTYIWDLRDSRRPSMSLSSVAGATQVRWNKQSRFLLATAHNGDVKLWDQRKGTAPVQYITAHLSNIHCLDWSPTHENQLSTSSQDCTVKFFDTMNPRRAENVITASAPVWRSRYTPFGSGMLMVLVPPMRRGDNSLLLWSLSNQTAPVHTFVGHTDIVLEFEWRKQPDSPDYQLITWSKDQTLRIWQIEPFLQKLCGIETETADNHPTDETAATTAPSIVPNVVESTVVVDTRISNLELTEGAITSEVEPPPPAPTQPKTLHQEFSLVNVNIRNVTFESMDPVKRKCSVTAGANGNSVVVHITFPPGYPHNTSPVFQLAPSTTVDNAIKTKLLKVLKQTAQQRVKKNRSCLEPCIRQLVSTLEELSKADETEKTPYHHMQGSLLQPSTLYSSFQDAYIPFPRTSGAKFCNVGTLVCFVRTPNPKFGSSRADKLTPRSLSAMNTFSDSPMSVPPYYFHDRARSRVSRGLSRAFSQKAFKATVVVYNVSSLFPVQRDLAEKYVFDSNDVASMCQKNATVASSFGRKDLAQVWSLASLVATPATYDLDEDFPWAYHPFSLGMIHSLIAHYARLADIQTAAMLSCAFGHKVETVETTKTKSPSKTNTHGGSPYHTIHPVDSSVEGWCIPVMKQNRSNSWSESLDDFRGVDNIVEHAPMEIEARKISRVTLNDLWIYNHYKIMYAEILHRWGLLHAGAQVMKYVPYAAEVHQGLEMVIECLNCKKHSKSAYCDSCRKPTLVCVICHTSVKGSANACISCGHGGHTHHLLEWFESNSICPTGCGCECLVESNPPSE